MAAKPKADANVPMENALPVQSDLAAQRTECHFESGNAGQSRSVVSWKIRNYKNYTNFKIVS